MGFFLLRVSSILVGIKDPFLPFETLICGIFFGGLVDTIKEMSQKRTKETEGNYADVNSKAAHLSNGMGDVNDTVDGHANLNEGSTETESDSNDKGSSKKDN